MSIIWNGRSEYQIVAPGRHYPAENHAARNLQDGLVRMTGVRLPVRWAHQRVADRPAIMVGSKDSPGDAELWHKDGYEIAPRDRDLVLCGTTRRATHCAVFAFMESLGAKFFGPDDVIYPRLDRVPLPPQAVRSTASFGYRNVFYPTAEEPEWAIKWGLNVHTGRDERWGVNAGAYSLGHSFAALVPLEKYFATHPEYFSLVDGRRRDRTQQLCCTNPAVADAASETMARWIGDNPHRRIFPVGMNDWAGWCECPQCAAVDKGEGGPTGQLLTLVNRVAGR
ncbi:MAG: DUF4838 domain-containing protein, partial [Planctomycetes bacterium]|nr:DUF4838 domain-containing protein [Planctomycetota bacterium]